MKILKAILTFQGYTKLIKSAEDMVPKCSTQDEKGNEKIYEESDGIRRQNKRTKEKEPSDILPYSNNFIHTNPHISDSIKVTSDSYPLDSSPFNLIYNNNTRACWLISLIHNIRANIELQKYILVNCKSEQVKIGLKALLGVNKRDIYKLEYYLFTYIWPETIDYLTKGGDDEWFMVQLLTMMDPNKVKRNTPQHINVDLCNFYGRYVNDINDIYLYNGAANQPIIEIRSPQNCSENRYFSVSNAVLGRPNNSLREDKSIQDMLIFNYTPKFIILIIIDTEREMSGGKKRQIQGIIIEKSIHINVKGKEKRQKYALTGIVLEELILDKYSHLRTIIKHENKWYDVDYCEAKELNKERKNYKLPRKFFGDELNTCDRVKVDYMSDKGSPIFVDMLFYQQL